MGRYGSDGRIGGRNPRLVKRTAGRATLLPVSETKCRFASPLLNFFSNQLFEFEGPTIVVFTVIGRVRSIVAL